MTSPSPQNSLIRVLGQYNLTLPKNAIEWRVCFDPGGHAGVTGTHGLHGTVTELITDGIVSWFLLGDHETLFFGHHGNFEPEPAPPSKRQPKPLKPELLAMMDDLD